MLKVENNKYIGWVPCLNGRLVFDLVECGLKSSDHRWVEVIYYGQDEENNLIEYVLVHSVVNWKDFGDDDLDGLWSVVLISKRNITKRTHEGSVYFNPNKNSNHADWKSSIELLSDINVATKTESEPDLNDKFQRLNQQLEYVFANDPCCYRAVFDLEQDGVVSLTYCNKGVLSDYEDGKIITRQAYYYIKYTWHRHQHHDSRAETLTTCHEIKTGTQNEEIADRLLGDLKRNLVRFKRSIDHSSHREVLKATGIISYTKALVEIMKSKDFISDDVYKKEINHLGYFQESLDAISSAIEKDMAMHNRAVNDARAIILFFFAIMTPALVINRQAISQQYEHADMPSYVRFVGDLYSNQTHFSIFVVFILLLLGSIISMQTRYGNSWIFWRCFTKPIAYMIKDGNPHKVMSNTQVISIIIMLFGLTLMIGFFVHLVYFF